MKPRSNEFACSLWLSINIYHHLGLSRQVFVQVMETSSSLADIDSLNLVTLLSGCLALSDGKWLLCTHIVETSYQVKEMECKETQICLWSLQVWCAKANLYHSMVLNIADMYTVKFCVGSMYFMLPQLSVQLIELRASKTYEKYKGNN